MQWDNEYDVIVIGSGAAGFTSALTAKVLGLSVLLIESSDQVGGLTNYSDGEMWIPNNSYIGKMGIGDSFERARSYLNDIYRDEFPEKIRDAFLYEGPKMIRFIHQNCHNIRFLISYHDGDFYPERIGALLRGRTLVTKCIRTKNLTKMLHLKKEKLSSSRSLITILLSSFQKFGGEIWLRTYPQQFIREGSRVIGLSVDKNGVNLKIKSKKGIVIAAENLHQGEGEVQYNDLSIKNSLNVVPFLKQKRQVFIQNINKPISSKIIRRIANSIIINEHAERFMNEMAPDHEFINGMLENKNVFWIMDQSGKNQLLCILKKIGVFISEDDFIKEKSISLLARRINVSSERFMITIWRYNNYVRTGKDSDFQRGESRFAHSLGNIKWKNPNLASIEKSPFYAVKIETKVVGWFNHFHIDEHTRLIQENGSPIEGLFATYGHSFKDEPAAGATLGMAMTFGYIAGKYLAKEIRN